MDTGNDCEPKQIATEIGCNIITKLNENNNSTLRKIRKCDGNKYKISRKVIRNTIAPTLNNKIDYQVHSLVDKITNVCDCVRKSGQYDCNCGNDCNCCNNCNYCNDCNGCCCGGCGGGCGGCGGSCAQCCRGGKSYFQKSSCEESCCQKRCTEESCCSECCNKTRQKGGCCNKLDRNKGVCSKKLDRKKFSYYNNKLNRKNGGCCNKIDRKCHCNVNKMDTLRDVAEANWLEEAKEVDEAKKEDQIIKLIKTGKKKSSYDRIDNDDMKENDACRCQSCCKSYDERNDCGIKCNNSEGCCKCYCQSCCESWDKRNDCNNSIESCQSDCESCNECNDYDKHRKDNNECCKCYRQSCCEYCDDCDHHDCDKNRNASKQCCNCRTRICKKCSKLFRRIDYESAKPSYQEDKNNTCRSVCQGCEPTELKLYLQSNCNSNATKKYLAIKF